MARIRSIHPDACKSEKLATLSAAAECAYWRLLMQADFDNLVEDDARLLRSWLYPRREAMAVAEVGGLMGELAAAGMVTRGLVGEDGTRYLRVREVRRSPLPASVRQRVIDRDGLACRLCGGSVERGDVHIDHIVPVADGGGDDLANLRVTHSACNLRRPKPNRRPKAVA